VAEDGATNLDYTFTRNGITSGTLVVNFSVGGTATFNTDYTVSGATTFTATNGSVTFAAGSSTAVVTVDPTPDTTFESDETVILTITTDPAYNPVAPISATGSITNDDDAPSFSIDDVTHNEGNGGTTSYTFTVTKTGDTALNASVEIDTQDGTATTADNDYQSVSRLLAFGAGVTTRDLHCSPVESYECNHHQCRWDWNNR
jgi:hypothetical protein